jgi:ABC-type multidrug transport system fused ATPase/permease subunit
LKLLTDLARLYGHISPRRRWQLAVLLVLMMAGALAEVATLGAVIPFLALLADPNSQTGQPMLRVFRHIFPDSNNLLLSSTLLFAAVAAGAAAIRTLLMWTSLRIGFGLGADLGGEVYRRILYQPYSWHVGHNSSEVLAGLDKVNTVVYNIITPLIQGCAAIVLSVGILCMLLAIDIWTAVFAGVSFSALYALTSILLKHKLASNDKNIAANLNRRVQVIQEGLGGIRDVLLDGTQSIYHRRFTSIDSEIRRRQAVNNLVSASPRYIIEAIGMVFLVALAGGLASDERGLAGVLPILGALALGAQKLLPQMQITYQAWSNLRGAQSQLRDVLDLLEKPISVACPESFRKPKFSILKIDDVNTIPLIRLKRVSFSYHLKGEHVLRDVNLEIHRGQKIGFIGKTGSGKSTLVDLMMGLLPPSSGFVEIDGKILDEKNCRAWQNRIMHVPQQIFLSDASIAENIAFGVHNTEIDFKRLRLAASQAQLDDFVASLPMGFNTSVGERGIRLSGGQRQRIGLARALYKQSDVLVLDEATSALDDATEESVMSAIRNLGSSLTILMIAHRVSTLKECSFIVELEAGSIKRLVSYEEMN